MDREEKLACRIAAVYVVCGFLTFGWNYNRIVECKDHLDPNPMCHRDKEFSSVLRGIVWPIWLAGETAIYVTRWP